MSPSFKAKYLIELRRGPSGVVGAPSWLRERMARLRAMPPPTLEEVRIQWAASARASAHPPRHLRPIIVR